MRRETSPAARTLDPRSRHASGGRPDSSLGADGEDRGLARPELAGGGEPLEIIASGRPLPDVLHALCAYLETAAADWERREAALKRGEAFLAQAQRLTKTGSAWWKPSTGEIVWSEENYRVMEYPVGLTPTVEMALDRCHPDDVALVQETLAAAIRTGATVDFEHRLLMPNGAVKHVRVVFQNIAPAHREPEYLGATTDVTEWTLAEAKLRRSEAQRDELRSELAHVAKVASVATSTAAIAHEVNQPLSGIVTNASTCLRMLANDVPNVEGAREMARRTIRDAGRAADVIARLRALFSRKPPTAEPLDLNEATRDVVALSQSELRRARVTVRLELAQELPFVIGDRVQLQQVIINLVRNASEAMREIENRPRELVIRTVVGDDDDRVTLSVRDSGRGFEGHGAEWLFDAFHTTKPDGMGIGLSVSRSIIESHRGRLWAAPNDGPGATFTFSIPRAISR
jgi:signal transduction histidine kinase